MEILKICGITVLGLSVSLILKNHKNALGDHVSTLTALTVMIASIAACVPIIQYVRELSQQIENGHEMITLMLKAFSIMLITQTISELCAQNGEKSLSNALEYASTVAIMLLLLPTIKEILSNALKLIKG